MDIATYGLAKEIIGRNLERLSLLENLRYKRAVNQKTVASLFTVHANLELLIQVMLKTPARFAL